MSNKIVVLGGGVAAGYFAKSFVEKGFPRNTLTIVSADVTLPYERPTLSKGYLVNSEIRRPQKFFTAVGTEGELQNDEWYQRHGISLYLNTLALSIDFNEKKLRTNVGDIPFGKLVLATGSENIRPNWPGKDLSGVHVLRDVADAEALVRSFSYAEQTQGRAVIVGGGYIGMETASGCMQNNIPTTMVFPNDRLMAPFFPMDVGLEYEQFYVEKGVEVRKFMNVVGFKPNEDGSRVKYVCLENGEELECAFAIVGVGARPRTELFRDVLDMHESKGVLVDEHMQTSHPDVYAIGDIAAFPDVMYNGGGHTRVEHVDHARNSAQHLANVLHATEFGGELEPYRYLPYFYSREFDKSWKFYGRQAGNCYIAGSLYELDKGFVVMWLDDQGYVQGTFAESARDEEFALLKEAADLQIMLNVQEVATAQTGKDVLFLIRDAITNQNPNRKNRPTVTQRIVDIGKSAYDVFSKVSEKMSTS